MTSVSAPPCLPAGLHEDCVTLGEKRSTGLAARASPRDQPCRHRSRPSGASPRAEEGLDSLVTTNLWYTAVMSEMSTTGSARTSGGARSSRSATREFAVGGLHGTPVEAIAKKVGVSQPYLFQLFGTKKDLFIAAVRRAFERTVATFRTAAAEAGEDAGTEAVLMSMGHRVPAHCSQTAASS